MMKDLENIIYNFLKSNCIENGNYGIGYSGGSDSKALLYLLVKNFASFNINLHVLHVDHAWREESKKEADFLESEIEELNLCFHRHTLEACKEKNNLEDKARVQRLLFFSDVSKKLDLKGIFLAHHADDLAETVLKRVLEGSQLENLAGMRPVSKHFNTNILRPLLIVDKEQIKAFLKKNGLKAINDPTNYDNRFLRARMREDLFPTLEEKFGKSFKNNLLQLSYRSGLLSSYLNEKLKELSILSSSGPFGCCYDFNEYALLHLFERNYILRKILKLEKLDINRSVFDQIHNCLESKIANKKFIFKKTMVVCDRGSLFFVKNEDFCFESFAFKIHKKSQGDGDKIGWRSFWEGSFFCPIPNEKVEVKRFNDLDEPDKRKLLNRWEKDKVPAFLRGKAPILWQNGKIIQDLLNSKPMFKDHQTCFFEWKIIT